MVRNLIERENGMQISSGSNAAYAIQTCTVTESVNSGTELTLGSACCACLEATVLDTRGDLSLSAGEKLVLYKQNDAGDKTPVGTFLLEAPTRKSENVYKITAYDMMTKLDKDLSDWLKGLKWPEAGYPLLTFARMVCKDACDLVLATAEIPNGSFPVHKFYKAGVTGRRLMEWIGEIACRFCRANADGNIEFGWYADSGVTVSATGERYFFGGALTYEDYTVGNIDAVRLRLADSESGALWPDSTAENPYIITGNPILLASVTNDLPPYLEVIQSQLAALPAYKPCKVSLPACLDIRPGHMVQIVDKHGNEFTTCVMTKTQTGQRDTLECTGSARRSSSTAANNQTAAQATQQAIENQTHEDIFNRLTKNGTIQGIYVQDDKWYINAEQVTLQNLKVKAADITGVITVLDKNGENTLFSAGNNAVTIAGWTADNNSIRYGKLGASGSMWLCREGTKNSPSSYDQTTGIAGTAVTKTGWCITVGNKFGVDSSGCLFAQDAELSGKIKATSGKIGVWSINEDNFALVSEYVSGYKVELHSSGIRLWDYTNQDGPQELGTIEWKELLEIKKKVLTES